MREPTSIDDVRHVEREAVRAGRSLGSRLPAHAFDSLAFQRLEDAAIWTRSWVAVGFSTEVARPGDVLPFTVGTHGIHIEHLDDGSLVGRFNKAQHGGCRTVPLQCQTGARTRCSFTACGHSHDRRPIAADDPERTRHLDQYLGQRPERLLRVDIRRWGPLLLARLDPRRELALDWPEPTRLLATAANAHGPSVWQEYEANWKHLAVILASATAGRERASLLFPNVVVREQTDHVTAVVLQPVGLTRTLCRVRVLGAGAPGGLPGCIATLGRRAEDVQTREDDATGSGDEAVRSPFERRVSAAVAELEARRPSDLLFRTADTGEW